VAKISSRPPQRVRGITEKKDLNMKKLPRGRKVDLGVDDDKWRKEGPSA